MTECSSVLRPSGRFFEVCPNYISFNMAISSIQATEFADANVGAFTVDVNAATLAGYATLGVGTALAAGIGTMVAPVPTLGLATVGGGLVVAGNFDEIKERFASKKDDKKLADSVESAA